MLSSFLAHFPKVRLCDHLLVCVSVHPSILILEYLNQSL
jgi:hypothetical protein